MNQNESGTNRIPENTADKPGVGLDRYVIPKAWRPSAKIPEKIITAVEPSQSVSVSPSPSPVPDKKPEETVSETATETETEAQTKPGTVELSDTQNPDTVPDEPESSEPEEEKTTLRGSEKPSPEENKEPDFATRLWRRIKASPYSYLFFAFLIPTVLMCLLYFVRGTYPFGDESILVLDMNGQYVYFFESLRNAVTEGYSFLYSFFRGLGGEYLGTYAYYIASPLSYLVLLFPKAKILDALFTILVLKTGLCGLTFGYYLHKTCPKRNIFHVIAFACLYALSSYAIVHQHNTMWIDALIWLPLLTFGIEQLIHKGKYKLYVVSLSVTILSNFYIGYMICLYVILYFFYCLASQKTTNDLGERYHLPRTFGRVIGFSVLSVGIAAVLILAAYYSLSFGKNAFTSPNWKFELRFELIDLLAKFFPGAYDTVEPQGLPTVYCGTVTLLLLPFYFLNRKVTLREKIFSLVFIGIFVASFIISPLDIIWHGLQKPNWLNYRYSFLLIFFLLKLAHRAIVDFEEISSKILLVFGTALIFIVILLRKFDFPSFILDGKYGFTAEKIDPFRTVLFTIVAVIALCAALSKLVHAKEPYKVRLCSLVLLGVICLEAFCNGIIDMSSLDVDVSYSGYSGYNKYLANARRTVDPIKENDTSFYRMEKTTQRKDNDNMALGVRGLAGSTSTLNRKTIDLISRFGYLGKAHRTRFYGNTPLSDSLLGIKYLLCEQGIPESYSYHYESKAREDTMKLIGEPVSEDSAFNAYRNPYALPIAYAVDDAFRDFAFTEEIEKSVTVAEDAPVMEKLIASVKELLGIYQDTVITYEDIYSSPFERLNALVTAMVGAEEEIRVFVPVPYDNTYTTASKAVVSGHTRYTPKDENGDTYILYNLTMPTDAPLYFYAPDTVYSYEAKVYVGDEWFGYFMGDYYGYIKNLGVREMNSSLTVKLILTEDRYYTMNDVEYFYYLDVDALRSVMEKLSETVYEIEDYTEDSFNGTFTTGKEHTTVFTSIPYDEGWKITVDGKEVTKVCALDGLISFDIEGNGKHTVDMVYSPEIVMIGAWISLGSLIVFAVIVTVDTLIARKRKKKDQKEA